MPNWCHNTLTVTGDEKIVAALVAKAQLTDELLREQYAQAMFVGYENGKPDQAEWMAARRQKNPLTFERFVPMPKKVGDGWYDWCLRNWGTKWDAVFGEGAVGLYVHEDANMGVSQETQGMTHVPGTVVWKFDTAWSPPYPVVEAMSEQFPDLEFVLRWGEVGNDAAGELKCVAGLRIVDEDREVSEVLAPEEMWF